MAHFQRLFLIACLAGTAAGLVAAVLQQFTTVPLILAAESYEAEAEAKNPPDLHSHDHDAAWQPRDGLERTVATALTEIITGIGYGLLLVALWALRGQSMNWRRGAAWGLAGFLTAAFAPAMGLPPELPGTVAAALGARQTWWLLTVICTGAGLGLICFGRGILPRAGGLILLAAPQLFGAPPAPLVASLTPAAMTRQFVFASLGTGAVFWLVLGALAGEVYRRFEPAH